MQSTKHQYIKNKQLTIYTSSIDSTDKAASCYNDKTEIKITETATYDSDSNIFSDEGASLGAPVGDNVGGKVGTKDGAVGALVGANVGAVIGAKVGAAVGSGVVSLP
eukprot:1074098_1